MTKRKKNDHYEYVGIKLYSLIKIFYKLKIENSAPYHYFAMVFQGRRNRESEIGKLKQGQKVWAICSQLVTNKPLSSPAKHMRANDQQNLPHERIRKGRRKGKRKKKGSFTP